MAKNSFLRFAMVQKQFSTVYHGSKTVLFMFFMDYDSFIRLSMVKNPFFFKFHYGSKTVS